MREQVSRTERKAAGRGPFFYGWFIVLVTAVTCTVIYGVRHSFAVFFTPILDEFGWSRGSTAVMLSLNILVYGLLAPVAGSLGDRWKPRRVMPIGLMLLAVGTAASSLARQLWHFYLLFGILIPAGTAFCGWPILAPALSNWFAKRRGLVIGLAGAGGSLSFTFGIFVEFVISQAGWREAFLVLAAIPIVVLLPLSRLFFYRPEEKGLKAYGAAELPLAAETTTAPPPHDWTLGEAMKTYQLWLLALSQLLYWGLGNYMVLAHQVRYAQDVGYSAMFAASVFGLFGICDLAGKLSASISDRLGREKTVVLSAVLSIIALAALISVRDASQPWLLYVYAIGFGYGAGLFSPTVTAGAADIFHGRHFGAILGVMITGMGLGGAIGPWLGGYIYDVTGSYAPAFFLSMSCYVLSCISFLVAAPRHAARLTARARQVEKPLASA